MSVMDELMVYRFYKMGLALWFTNSTIPTFIAQLLRSFLISIRDTESLTLFKLAALLGLIKDSFCVYKFL